MKKISFIIIILILFSQNNISFALNTASVQENLFSQKYQNDRSYTKQKLIENFKLNELKKTLLTPSNDSFIYNFISTDIQLFVTNNDFEFVQWNDIKRLIFTNYYDVRKSDYNFLKGKKWIIVNVTWTNTFMFIEDYEVETKIPYSKLSKYTKWYITENSKYFLENEVYYSYIFNNSLYYKSESYWLYLKLIWDISNYIFYKRADWKYAFIKDYKKVKVISSYIIESISWKYEFLRELTDDVLSPWFKNNKIQDYDEDFKKLKKESIELTKWLGRDDKIKKIYNYVLENTSYSKKIDFSNKQLFSWIDTYKNKEWICLGYTKLFIYMLDFSWVDNVEVVRWDVIDAIDFPTVWHAWVKIGDYYYDPTFDDPIWTNKTRKYSDYKYFKLPKDIFYTNRYENITTPSDLKTTTLDYRKNLVKENISKLVSKYRNYWFNLLKPYVFRENNNLSYNESITINKLTKIKTFYKVKNNYLDIDWKKYPILSLNYIVLKDENLETALEQINYDIDKYYFLDFDLWNWNKEYRLAINIKF